MESLLKNIEKSQVLRLKEELAYQQGQIVSKTLVQNDAISITLFSFSKGEEISTHESKGDAFVTSLDGVGLITIDGKDHELKEGESIVMPARHPHAVLAKENFKMLLVVVF
ncbi:cupin domain-containing protein [Faecalicoccus pleomorphus]|uniref:cupin domain-containing protein n=1 Tax=Faecalicoccus pleomorphus TaxID=1323 RepID=UPI0039F502FB